MKISKKGGGREHEKAFCLMEKVLKINSCFNKNNINPFSDLLNQLSQMKAEKNNREKYIPFINRLSSKRMSVLFSFEGNKKHEK